MPVSYEWDVEELEEAETEENGFDPDIKDHDFHEKFRDAMSSLLVLRWDDGFGRVVLVRSVWTDEEGLVDRAWAYLDKDNRMPETFSYGADEDSGIAVPKRFHNEVDVYFSRNTP